MKPKVKKWLIRGTLLGIASGSIYLYLLPRLLPHELSWWRPDICFRGNADRKRLYLTIDDGPSDSTPAILAVLKKQNVPATFFIVGDQVHSDEQLRSIVEAGHSLGHHMRTFEPGASMCGGSFSMFIVGLNLFFCHRLRLFSLLPWPFLPCIDEVLNGTVENV